MDMTKRKEQIEHVLRDLAAEPVQAGDEFKQRLIATLRQEQRDMLQAQAGQRRRLGGSFSHWVCSWWSRPAVRWAFVVAVLVLALAGILIPWTFQRPLLTIHQGVAQVSPPQPSRPGSRQGQGDVISIAEGARITMDENSTASLLLFNGSKVELLPGTQLTLTRVQPRSIWRAQAVHMQVTTGRVQVQVSPLRSPAERFEVELPAALVSVRGTAFRAQVISPQHTYVATDEGVVAVTLHDPSQGNPLVEVPAGHEVDAIIGQPLDVRRQAASASAGRDTTGLRPNPRATEVRSQATRSPIWGAGDPVTATPASRPAMTVTTPSGVTTGTVRSESVITGTIPATPIGAAPTAVSPPADLELVQVDTPEPTVAEGMLTYMLLVANHGPGDARDVVVRDVLPPQVHIVDATLPTVGDGSGQASTAEVGWELGTLTAGDRRALQVVVAVHSWVTRSFTNTAVVTSATHDNNPHNNQATVETAITDVADLAISAKMPTVIRSGSVVTCTLVYTNFGPAAAHSVTIVQRLGAEISFGGVVNSEPPLPLRATAMGTLTLEEPMPAAWTTPKLVAGASGRIVFTATVPPDVLGPLTSTATITSTSPDSNWHNNDHGQVTLARPVANVAIAQSAFPDPVVAGGMLTYTLTYTNHGPWAAKGVFVTATLPASVTLAGQAQSGQSLTWSTPSLLPGASRTVVLTVTVDRRAAGPLDSRAVVRSATLDSNPDDNTAAGSVHALTPALSLAQTVQPGAIAPHQPCTVTLHVTNTGAVTFAARSLSLVEMLPPGFRPVTITAAQPVTRAQTWVWRNPAPLAPRGSFSVSLALLAAETVSPGLYLNAARATATVPGGPITATAPMSVHLTLPSVAVAQQVIGNGSSIVTSDRVTLTICLTNTGPSPLAAVPLLERHDPRVLRFVDAAPNPEEAPGDGTIAWRNLIQAPPHGIGPDLFPGEALTVTLAFDVAQPSTAFESMEIHWAVGKLRDVYGNLSDGRIAWRDVYQVQRLYLPLVIRSS
jgi:uncharacterized repeat protein (TIGR01451 family)